jgi:hypothetical protein
MEYTLNDFEVGDYVHYSTWGSSEVRRVYVEEKFVDENGRQGFQGFLVDSLNNRVRFPSGDIRNQFGAWGYCEQIISIEKENSNA